MAARLRAGDAASAGEAAAAALAVALCLGASTLALLALFGQRFICMTGCAPNLVTPACSYLRVRMLAAPAVVITMVAQACIPSGAPTQFPLKNDDISSPVEAPVGPATPSPQDLFVARECHWALWRHGRASPALQHARPIGTCYQFAPLHPSVAAWAVEAFRIMSTNAGARRGGCWRRRTA